MAEDDLRQLAQEARGREHPTIVPADAATLIVVDRSGRVPRVLMGRRNPRMVFMPGKFVFPGGRIDRGDRGVPLAAGYRPETAARLAARMTRPTLPRRERLGLAAIRETFEETGLVIGQGRPPATGAVLPEAWQAFAALGAAPALDGLIYVARATTPPRRPRRFDTRFFAVDADRVIAQDSRKLGPDAELVELAWVSLQEARGLDLPAITGVVLNELERRLAGDFAADQPVPYYYERRGRFLREEL
jgi:8-oxo-dGTP pyrophosphatase MutT (NUDIX family)